MTPTVRPILEYPDTEELKFAREAPKGHLLVVRQSWPREGQEWEELKASIERVGVLVPLVFKKIAGKKYVIAGNRRLDISRVIGLTVLPAIDADNYPGVDARELALAHNIALPPHPVDRYEVFVGLIRDGMKEADLGARFVLTKRQVAQVLALGNLAPEIREEWRKGEIDAEVAQAFTLAPTHIEQLAAFKTLKKQQSLFPRAIQQRLVGKQEGLGRFLVFVGADAYAKAGGTVVLDLFENRNHRVSDVKLLNRMAAAKIAQELDRLVKTEGWAWAEPEDTDAFGKRHIMTRLPQGKPTAKEQKELNRLTEQTESATDNETALVPERALKRLENEIEMRAYTAKAKARAGCFVGISDDGELAVQYGFIKPAEVKKPTTAAGKKAAAKTKGKAPKADAEDISNSLAQRLSQQLTEAAAAVMQNNPNIGIAALVAGFSANSVSLAGPVCVTEHGLRTKKNDGPYRKLPAFAGTLKAMLDKKPEDSVAALGVICAQALNFETHSADMPPLEDKNVAAVCAALPGAQLYAAMRDKFNAADYFESVSAALCKAALTEMKWTTPKDTKGKAGFVKVAVHAARETGWLPPMLRAGAYKGPGAK